MAACNGATACMSRDRISGERRVGEGSSSPSVWLCAGIRCHCLAENPGLGGGWSLHVFMPAANIWQVVAISLEETKLTESAAGSVLKDVLTLIRQMRIAPMKLEDFTLGNDHEYVQTELSRRLGLVAEVDQPSTKATRWQEQYGKFLLDKGVLWSSIAVPQAHARAPFYPTLCERQRTVLGYWLHVEPHFTGCDIGQGIDRAFISKDGLVSTVIPRSVLYLNSLRRPALGYELMLLQGFPQEHLVCDDLAAAGISDTLLAELGGNSFSAQAFLPVLLSVLALARSKMSAHNQNALKRTAGFQSAIATQTPQRQNATGQIALRS